jgi:RNA polymerase sigma-70 factor (ECF subfamily)
MTIDWPTLVREFGPLVWRTAQRLLHNEADVSDCFQETFLSALEFSRRQSVTNWPGLLQRIATARALDQLRRRGRDRTIFDNELDDHQPSPSLGPSQRAEAAELGERLRNALTQLPPQQSQAFCLRHLNGMDYGEIASEMQVTIDAAGSLLHRARARLGEMLLGAATSGLKRR